MNKATTRALLETLLIVVLALFVAWVVQFLIVKPYQIPSESMVPTLKVGQRILVDKVSPKVGWSPKLGDVVVFYPPVGATPAEQDPTKPLKTCATEPVEGQMCPKSLQDKSSTAFVKRVVGLPGDRLFMKDGEIYRNGEILKGDWTNFSCLDVTCQFPKEIVVPPDSYFMIGDNRGKSDDSRFWGPVPRDFMIGPARATYWPVDRFGGI